MRLRVLLPHRVLVDREVTAVNGEGPEGSFGILPRHIDMATALVAGLLSYRTSDGEERFVATDGGILVKRGADVLVSTRNASEGRELGTLRQQVDREFDRLDQHERRIRSALAYLESDLARRINELSRRGGP